MARKDEQVKSKGVFVLAGLEYNSISLVVERLDSDKVIRDMDHYCNSDDEITRLKSAIASMEDTQIVFIRGVLRYI